MPINDDTISWVKVADFVGDIPFGNNGMAEVMAGGKKVCIARYKEALFAFAYKCPHAGGILANGYMDALGNVVCPVHHYKFCPRNGRNVSGEGYCLKHWPVAIKTDGVFIGLEANALLRLL